MRHGCPVGEHSSRREIDIAIGVLMGLTGCAERNAFDLLATAVHQTGIGLGEASAALISAVGEGTPAAHNPGAVSYWRHTIAQLSD